jgi:hypothetical protein
VVCRVCSRSLLPAAAASTLQLAAGRHQRYSNREEVSDYNVNVRVNHKMAGMRAGQSTFQISVSVTPCPHVL